MRMVSSYSTRPLAWRAQAGAQGSALPTIGGGEIVIVQGDWRPAALGRAEAHTCGAGDLEAGQPGNPACTAIERAESAPEASQIRHAIICFYTD